MEDNICITQKVSVTKKICFFKKNTSWKLTFKVKIKINKTLLKSAIICFERLIMGLSDLNTKKIE